MYYKDKVFYECKNFPPSGYSTMMLFGFIFTKKTESEYSGKTKYHEEFHLNQYTDCFGLGLGLAILSAFVLFAFNIVSLWMISLVLLPLFLFYFWYGINFIFQLIKFRDWDTAYKNVIFERQAYKLGEEWYLPCEKQTKYTSFSFLKY